MERLLTSKELANAIGASESSLRRWANTGVIRTSRTVGGHRRIPLSEAVRFIRESGATVVRPQALGLGEATTTSPVASAADDSLFAALCDGDAERAVGLVLSMYLAGTSLASIFDGPIGRAMHRVGDLWEHDARGIFVEHRATDLCLQAVNRLRALLAPAEADAPAALGGAPQGDPYLLPSMMAAAVLAEAGYRVTNLGADTPFDVLAKAAVEQKAALAWLSVSVADPQGQVTRDVANLAADLAKGGTSLVVGGRHAAALATKAWTDVHVLAGMGELSAFARGAKPGRKLRR
jgi:excisionase family DNA binding protein